MSSNSQIGVGTTVDLGELEVPMADGDIIVGDGSANPVIGSHGDINGLSDDDHGSVYPALAGSSAVLNMANFAINNIGAAGNDFGSAQLDLASGYTILGAGALTLSTTTGDLTITPSGNTIISIGDLEMNDAIHWDTSVAVTASRVEITRVTNDLHYNIPSGGLHSWRVNDVTAMSLSSTALDLADNEVTNISGLILTERAAAAAGDVAGFGQLFVKNDTPNVLIFRDDAGTEVTLGAGGAGGGASFKIFAQQPPAANAATTVFRAGASTPAESFETLAFDDATIEYMDFKVIARNYDTTKDIEITIKWGGDTATTNDVIWGAAIRELADGDDAGVSHTYVFTDAAASTVPGVVDKRTTLTLTLTSGANVDNVADGAEFHFRLRRNATAGGDNMVGDALLWLMNIEEAA